MKYLLYVDEDGNPAVIRSRDHTIRINSQDLTEITKELAEEIANEEL